MDPLSASASIIALLQLTGTVISYLSDVSDGPRELQSVRLEISSALGILIMLQDQANQAKQGDSFLSTLKSLNVPYGPFEQFHTALERLALKLAPVQGWRKIRKVFKWPFEKEEIHEILNIIERQKSLFNLARQNDHIALSKAIGGDIKTIQNGVNKISVGVVSLQIGERHNRIRRWLSAPDPSSNYNKALKNRSANTGDWFLQTTIYSNWLSEPGSLLWLYGIPGCGKTILSSTIIQQTVGYCQSRTSSIVLYFYFDFNDVEKQQHEKMIRWLIIQLSLQHTSTLQALESLYSSCGDGESQPVYDLLLATLHQMIGYFRDTYLIIDALDECIERGELLTSIEKLAGWKDVNLHILTTSRGEKDIRESIEPLVNDQGKFCIQGKLVDNDICAYIRNRLQTDRDLKRWRDKPEVQKEIENTLMAKADGMFRWAACQLDSLKNCFNLPGLRKALGSLPKTLDDTYTRILRNIDKNNYQDAVKILQWLTYSARPLELKEVAECIAIHVEESPRFASCNRYPEPQDIFAICSSLISLEDQDINILYDKSDRVIVKLAHLSVKEYLVSETILQSDVKDYSIQEISANISIHNDCLAYLLELDGLSYLTPQVIAEFPLAKYAAEYWIQHAQVVEKDTSFNPLLRTELFLTNGFAFLNWIRLYDPDKPWAETNLKRTLKSICPPLYYASLAGLCKSVQILLDMGANVNAQGGLYGNALQAASHKGHDIVAQMLLDKGADVNAQGGYYGNPLQAASHKGHDIVAQMLLDKGANVNAQGGRYGNALRIASARGYETIVQMLLDKEADANVQGGYYGNALQAASHGGHDIVAQMLLDKGANVNAQGGLYGNALQAALDNGHDIVAQLLLDKGADVNAQGGHYGNALQAASHGGYDTIVQILLDKGADVNAQGEKYGNALQAVSVRGYANIARMLVSYGADVNAQDSSCNTALKAAAWFCRTEIARFLIESGADVNITCGVSGTALKAAIQGGKIIDGKLQSIGGKLEIIDLLLESRADPNIKDETQKTALMIAAIENEEQIVKALLSSGADPGIKDGLQRSALYWAACYANSDSFDVIVEAIRFKPYAKAHFGSALHEAVARNCPDILTKLLRESVDLDYVDRNGWSPLYCAQQYRLKNIEEMLITAGVSNKVPILQQPSRWEESGKAACLTVLDNGRAVIVGQSNMNSYNIYGPQGTIRANHCMTPSLEVGPDHGVYYFEVEILKGGKSKTIGVGFGEENFNLLHRLPGWDPGSWGYHGDDGCFFNESGSGKGYGPTFDEGDIIGCGVNFERETAFFTKNGEMLGDAFDNIRGKLYPMVGFDTEMTGAHISVNFEEKDFRFQGSLTDTAKKVAKIEQDIDVDDQDEEGRIEWENESQESSETG